MRKHATQFGIFFLMHFLFFYLFLAAIEAIAIFFFNHTNSDTPAILLLHGTYSIVYFFLIWKNLYSYSYHTFVNQGTGIVIRNTVLSTIITSIIVSAVFFAENRFFSLDAGSSVIYETVAVLSIDISLYIIVFGIQTVWVGSLIKIGFIGKKVLTFGEPDARLPVREMLNNTLKTRHYAGNITFSGDRCIYSDNENNSRELTFEEMCNLLCSLQIGEVFIFIGTEISEDIIYKIADLCRKINIGYYIVPDLKKLPERGFWARSFPYVPIIESFVTRTDSLLLISIKRLIDVLVISISSIILIPLFIAVAIAIKIEDGGPVFYLGKRVGRNGKLIKFYKFRTMVQNADQMQKDLLHLNERKDGPLFKMTNDPRLTKVGRFIRRYNIDELPQIFNVLKGDLSIVGPRPHLASEVEAYEPRDLIRLETIPGITCYPQITNDFKMGFREWMDLDLEYRKKWSLKTDIVIMAALFFMIISPKKK